MVSVDDLWEVLHGLFKEPIIGPLNSKWQMANILKIVFFGQNSAVDCPVSMKFCTGKQNSIAIKARCQTLNFDNSRQIVKSPFLNEKSFNFDEIWYTNADLEIKMVDDRHFLKSFLAIIQQLISAKFYMTTQFFTEFRQWEWTGMFS